MKDRVLVAMSGGVDSSVAAYLLKQEGYDVVGVTFQLYDYSRLNRKEGKGGCCSLEDVEDARHVCQKLGIPHYLFDSRDRFKARVLDYFAESYKQGKTPNPCVACNTFIKFDELAHYARAVDAKYFATGHYARMCREGDHAFLEAAADPKRDQSYFLMGVGADKLQHLLLPLGDLHKDEVRAIAHSLELPVSDKPDSMEICFVPDNNYRKFLEAEYQLADDPGNIVDLTGHVIGQHRGVHHFTVGQRKGLAANGFPSHYVISIDAQTKEVKIGEDRSLYSQGLIFQSEEASRLRNYFEKTVQVKIRSRAPFIEARLRDEQNGSIFCEFVEPQRAVTPGQFAVIYDGKRVVGGGPILKAMANLSNVV
jgi:tRNA-specific 2-thiouridylase